MKKVLSVLINIIALFMLVGCSNNSLKLGLKSFYKINNDYITMNVEKDSISNIGVTVKLLNNTEENYEYGSEYFIEYKKNSIWYTIQPKSEMNFTMMAYLLEKNETKIINLNWESSYGTLPKGTYRIIKIFSPEENVTNDIYVSAEFSVE